MTPQEQLAQAIKILRKQAQDSLMMADWMENSFKFVDTPEIKQENAE